MNKAKRARVQKHIDIRNAIANGLNEAAAKGYTKDYDVAMSVHYALLDAGFIVNRSKGASS